METLPAWMQWLVAIASVVSSIGVIIAFVQLKISGNQFKEQLQITEQQFKLLNQGYVDMMLHQDYFTETFEQAQKANIYDPTCIYQFFGVTSVFTNVGNVPVKLVVNSFHVFFNGVETFQLPADVISRSENIVHPKQNLSFRLGNVYFNEQKTSLHLAEILALNVTYKILVSYHDYNNNTRKTIDRELQLSGLNLITTLIKDEL